MTTQAAAEALALPVETLHGLYRDMWRIRRFEETALYHSTQGDVYGALHLYIGEEATAVGVCSVLSRDDYVASTHRGHGHCIAKGARMDRMMAELFGRATGSCKGKGGSMHITDFSCGMLGANGIVGASLGLAAGAALMGQVRRSGQIAVAFFGDGAATRGTFHEVLNLSSLWKLPVLFVCENNGYAQWMSQKENLAAEHVVDMARSYNMPGVAVDGNDVLAVHAAAAAAAARARAGLGPTLLECKTYRIYGHSLGDLQVYREKAEVEEWKKRDPILRFEARLREAGLLGDAERQAILDAAEAEVEPGGRLRHREPVPRRLRAPHRRHRLSPRARGDRDHAHADVPRRHPRGPRRGDGPLPQHAHPGRGPHPPGRGLRRLQGPRRAVPGPAPPDPDLGGRHRRPGSRRGPGRRARRRRDHVLGLPDLLHGRDREPGRQAPLHVRRPGAGAPRGPHHLRPRQGRGRPALASRSGPGSPTSPA